MMNRSQLRALRLFAPLSGLLLCGFLPYEHTGVVEFTVDDRVVSGSAVFSTAMATNTDHVLVRAVVRLPTGGEGYLSMEVPVASRGEVQATVRYYEKISPTVVNFEAQPGLMTVRVDDRFEAQGETSLLLGFDLSLRDGQNVERRLDAGLAVTAPSPITLRQAVNAEPYLGTPLPPRDYLYDGGVYEQGSLDCFGTADTVVVVDEVDEIVYVDDPSNGETDWFDDETDEVYDFTDSGSSFDDGDSDLDCGSDDSEDYDYDYEDSSDEDDDLSCTGDAEASDGGARGFRLSRRARQLSPLLLAIFVLWVGRTPEDEQAA